MQNVPEVYPGPGSLPNNGEIGDIRGDSAVEAIDRPPELAV
jgi:hypothetical protein